MERFPSEVKQFIEKTKWTYAKTMPAWPHYYIVRDKVNETLFIKLAEYIRKFGYLEHFNNKPYTYFDDGGFKYWTMGNPIEETTIINRARKEDFD